MKCKNGSGAGEYCVDVWLTLCCYQPTLFRSCVHRRKKMGERGREVDSLRRRRWGGPKGGCLCLGGGELDSEQRKIIHGNSV